MRLISEKWFEFLRLVMVVFLLLATEGRCIRQINKGVTKNFGDMFEPQLPRGPVPPSGPSPCHNKLGPYSHREFWYPDDYVNCP
ncbi:hypothetical protein COLO4_20476 [Corchorus olitorius]|uniref:Uncharacterized protein n=1 Tax=Corchorus olitorius TaxID=93759 RepID=A0A1R3IZV1_9ROSI|nr:hypothetical protein COLO4_20476 [Corchorus olitorius]